MLVGGVGRHRVGQSFVTIALGLWPTAGGISSIKL